VLIDAQAQIPIARARGGGLLASAGGLRFVVPVRTINAGPSPKYFGCKRGITWLNAGGDQVAGIGQMAVPGTPRDSLFILDTLLNLDAGPKPGVVATGTASCSDMVFGVFAILNYRFAPRFADLPGQRYWRAALPGPLPANAGLSPGQQAIGGYGPLEPIARNTVNVAKIATRWPDMLRVAGSLVTSQVRACDLLRMFGRDGHPTPLGQAFIEYGRIARTLHLLALVDPVDGSYQRRMNRQLTVQESRHRLGRKICHGHRGQIRRAYREGQEDQVAALGLVLHAVVLEYPLPRRHRREPARQRPARARRGCRPAVPARARAPQLPGSLRLHHPAACRAAAAARPERTRRRGRRRVLTSPARGSRRGTCGLSWPARADVTRTGDGGHGRESWFAAMLDL
jgi:TnpA family transposase